MSASDTKTPIYLRDLRWSTQNAILKKEKDGSIRLETENPDSNFQISSQTLYIPKDLFPVFHLRGQVESGSVIVGLLDSDSNDWILTQTLSHFSSNGKLAIDPAYDRVVLSLTTNPKDKNPVRLTLSSMDCTVTNPASLVWELTDFIWSLENAKQAEWKDGCIDLITDDSDGQFQITSQPLFLPKDLIPVIDLCGNIDEGNVVFGLIDIKQSQWIASQKLSGINFRIKIAIAPDTDRQVVAVIANLDKRETSRLSISHLKCQFVSPETLSWKLHDFFWTVEFAKEMEWKDDSLHVVTDHSESNIQFYSQKLYFPDDWILLNLEIEVHDGCIVLGILNQNTFEWNDYLIIRKGLFNSRILFDSKSCQKPSIAIANSNAQNRSRFTLHKLDLSSVKQLNDCLQILDRDTPTTHDTKQSGELEQFIASNEWALNIKNVQSVDLSERILQHHYHLRTHASPIPFTPRDRDGAQNNIIPGKGIYLRMDHWQKIESGGSYSHTCYVSKELSNVTEEFVCMMPSRFSLLDEFNVRQMVLDSPDPYYHEGAIIESSPFFASVLDPIIKTIERPAYIYERFCLANYVGALMSQRYGIPYILEYNGSEMSIKRSFESAYENEDYYYSVEDRVFKQATAIVVVSELIKEDLVKRQVDQDKILVNPNGVDTDHYQPLPLPQKNELKQELGFDESDCVAGFISSFGGWHGIETLAKALPELCGHDRLRFLLIGDGINKHLIDECISKHNLSSVVQTTGSVPQNEGCRLLGACDIFLSPHDSHMADSRFFGSPLKIFEYMSLGGGIVASDLEQIGEVLSPAIRPDEFDRSDIQVTDQRAVLCKPGDVDEFVRGVVFLANHPTVRNDLGRNARNAALQNHTWKKHVDNIIEFVSRQGLSK